MSEKKILVTRDGKGEQIVLVPLGAKGNRGIAVLDKEDFDLLDELGMSWNWNRLPSGYVTASCSYSPNRHILPARAIVDAGRGDRVIFRDGDPTNHRRHNLQVVNDGYAWRRDRDYLRPSTKNRRKQIPIEYRD